jgi:GntR family transcriptional regulator
MEDTPLYQKIVESIRKQILIGQLQPGDRLPSVRQMTAAWDCTPERFSALTESWHTRD